MTRLVGIRDRDEFVLDPVEAWRRGRALDRMLPMLAPRVPFGVQRARHEVFNAIDDERQVEQARRVNK